ncbi:MAG: hypothetical protein IPL69_10520 [Saprospiraceae bacterium]|nr:hypothetical protein [Candidatus Brachybacter algidus]
MRPDASSAIPLIVNTMSPTIPLFNHLQQDAYLVHKVGASSFDSLRNAIQGTLHGRRLVNIYCKSWSSRWWFNRISGRRPTGQKNYVWKIWRKKSEFFFRRITIIYYVFGPGR